MYVCMYVCMYAHVQCMCVYACIPTIHTYTHTYIHTYIIHTYTHIHTYIHTYIHILYIHTHIHTYIHILYIHTHTGNPKSNNRILTLHQLLKTRTHKSTPSPSVRGYCELANSGSMQKLDSGLDWTMDWTLDWTLDSMYFSSYRPCHHKYSPLFASTSVLRRFCTLACMVFRLSKPAKAGLCFPKHALICILIITLIIKAAAELPVTQN